MDRRSFIASGGGAVLAAAASAAGFWRWQEVTPHVADPGRTIGHMLRDRAALPAPSSIIETDVAILGSGIAGLSAAWQLDRLGKRDFLVFDGPEAFGNAAGARLGGLACPTGAHYLPLPGMEALDVREMLADLKILQGDPRAERPTYDERFLVHAPHERLLLNGAWQEGMVPSHGVDAAELAEYERFFAHMDRLRHAFGNDGRRAFVFPAALSSSDPAYTALDRITFADWLARAGYRSPSLRWYLDYCCRDDYGAPSEKVSAWAGIHYFAGRWAQAANAADNALLTWPDGLHSLAEALAAKVNDRRRAGTATSVRIVDGRAEALCFVLENGQPRSFLVRARRMVCAMPLFVAARVVEPMASFGFDARRDLPLSAPWMVANFLMRDFPREQGGMPLAWDNVVHGGRGLGYVVSTHQEIRVTPPKQTVFTAYIALSERTPLEARRWMQDASPQELLELASADLKQAYGLAFMPNVERVELTLRAHAMAVPAPGMRSNPGLAALRELDGPLLFAHADLSGFSVFEEAAWWGCQAARRIAGA